MAYTEELLDVNKKGSAQAAAEDLSAAASHGEDLIGTSCVLKQIKFLVTTSTVGAATVTFTRRPTAGSAAGAVTLGTITVPGGTAAGAMIVNNITPTRLSKGDGLEFSVSSAGTSGAGYYMYDLDYCPEHDPNEADVTVVTS